MRSIINIFCVLFFNFLIAENYIGYLRTIEASFCMDECSQYYIETETGEHIDNLSFDDIDPTSYLNRYINVEGELIWCVECGALLVQQISLPIDCEYPVMCFVDPCEVASECEINTPVECVSNYCGGCYADFYDLEGNLVDCNNPDTIDACHDVGGIFFGVCDMFMGIAVVNGQCQGVSGCGWIVDDVDYTNAFFNSMDECETLCINEPYLCEDIEYDYDQLHNGIYAQCDFDNDCTAIWGDCDVGLGGCHYAINEEYYLVNEVSNLVDSWLDDDCMQWVCDCAGLPNVICDAGQCQLAYCYGENPVGCFSSGCQDGYTCVNDPNYCVPSSCFCDGDFYGTWNCTEDCGGGTCVAILSGDVNSDGQLNVSDIVIIVNMILGLTDVNLDGDMNGDSTLDIIDVVMIINEILNN